jgi:predicted nucleic acid-binding protein
VIVIDTSVIVAYMNSADGAHGLVARWLDDVDDDLATTPLIVAEIDHLVGARGTRAALSALRSDLVAGAYLGEWSSESTGPGSALRAARIVKR